MNRREMIFRTAAGMAGLAVSGCAFPRSEAGAAAKKILFFSKSSGYEHSVIKRNGGELSFAEKILADAGPKHGIEFTFSKDGSLFSPEYVAQFDAFCFYTDGDLTVPGVDKNPPMTAIGKAALLDAIERGKGFIGVHSASATFPSKQGMGIDPYLQMLGGEFLTHTNQQTATVRVADAKFPGMLQQDLSLMEEWYSLIHFNPDIHVLLLQETQGMMGAPYQRPPYPSTWARRQGRGRVFYTGLGHREDVWTNPLFQELLFGGIAWAVRRANAEIAPNIQSVTPGFAVVPSKR